MNQHNFEIIEFLENELRCRQQERLKYDWEKQARPNQIPPASDWNTWLILAGRGFGKTRTGSETVRSWIKQGLYKHIALIGQSVTEVRQVMVEGNSGLLAVHTSEECPRFEPSNQRLIWENGAIATCFGANFYEKLRGPQFDL